MWATPLQERIFNYSASANNKFNGSFFQSGIILNSNKGFTSYSFFSQFWVSSNLALNGSIAPYIEKDDLYHYQYIGAFYHDISSENKYSPFSFNVGMHRLINKLNSGNDRWFNFGLNYYQTIWNQHISFNLNNFFTKNQSVKTVGLTHIIHLMSKINFNYGLKYQWNNPNISLKLNIEFPI